MIFICWQPRMPALSVWDLGRDGVGLGRYAAVCYAKTLADQRLDRRLQQIVGDGIPLTLTDL